MDFMDCATVPVARVRRRRFLQLSLLTSMTQHRSPFRSTSGAARQGGFTLIELMVTVAIVAILSGIALPMYRTYAIRGKLVAGTNALAALRTAMEQYYQDNRQYTNVSTTIVSPCASTTTADTFTLTCSVPSATTYTITATGSGLTNGAIYTIDQSNTQRTMGLPPALGSVPSNNACWIMRKGDSC
jgi:type IV pilus assembly protein PilE